MMFSILPKRNFTFTVSSANAFNLDQYTISSFDKVLSNMPGWVIRPLHISLVFYRIEHLYPETLKAACEMIFGGLRPKIVVVTTPNADYNQLFPNFTGFRHWDHKFEWTQQEFKNW